MTKRSLNFSEYKSKLVATKASDIHNVSAFAAEFTDIAMALGDTDVSEKQILKLDTMTIWFTRALQLLRIRPEVIKELHTRASSIQLLHIFNYVCQVYDTGNGPFTNAAMGLLSKLLHFINKTCASNKTSSFVVQLAESVMAIPSTQKSSFIIADAFIKDVDSAVSTLSSGNYAFSEKCMSVMWSSALANSASKAFASYYTRLHDPKISPSRYIDAWSTLVHKSLDASRDTYNIINILLPKLFRPCPGAFLDWVKALNIEEDTDRWRTLMLPLLNCAYVISPANDPIASKTLAEEDLMVLLEHSDEHTRRNSFSLVCAAISATKGPPTYALGIISNPRILSIFFKETNTPEARSDFYSLLRRALLHCRDYIVTQEKRMTKKADEELSNNLKAIKSKLSAIFEFTFCQLIPDSSYTQLALATDFLRFFIEYEFDGINRDIKKDVKARSEIFEIYNPKVTATLLRFVSNNYDDIRLQCSYMLSQCPLEIFEGIHRQQMTVNTFYLLSSLKGRQSDGGAQLVKSISQIYMKNERHEEFFALLHALLSRMNDAIKADIPVHGYFTAIGEVLSLISTAFYHKHQGQLNPIISSLLHTGFQMWEIFKPQMTLAPSEIEEDADNEAWRTVKENSFLLRTILKLNAATQWNAFDRKVFLSICDLLMNQLSNISHRGAFSAIYPTFVQACELCYQTDLNDKPFEWLEINLKLLETKEQLISRRSAGIPFLLTAILNSCVSDPVRLQSYLKPTFSELFRVAQIEYVPVDDAKNDLPQVHAFNCMRHIFRESSLSEAASAYIERALEVTLVYLDHPAWAIKNGAVMLFTALQERLFGSNKLGEVSSSRNARHFFSRYADVKSGLLMKLEESANFNDVFLVLSILSRLQTFSENDDTLQPFVDIIVAKTLGHSVWKIREMAAKSLHMMTHVDCYPQIMDEMVMLDGRSKNEIHGRLMCLLEFTSSSKKSKLDVSQFTYSVEKWFLAANKHHDWVNLRTALLILTTSSISSDVIELLKSQVQDIFSHGRLPLNGSQRLFLESAVYAILNACDDSLEVVQLSRIYLSADHYEAQLSTAEYWISNCERLNIENLQDAIIARIEDDNTWNHVKERCLELLVKTKVSLPKLLRHSGNWTESMSALNLVLSARSEEPNEAYICDSAIKLAADSFPERTRNLAVLAAKDLLFARKQRDVVNAKMDFMLFEKLSDDSTGVRRLACDGTLCAGAAERNSLHVFVEFYQEYAFELLLRAAENSIMSNLRDFQSERENAYFEIERSNLFRNEVSYHAYLVESLVILVDENAGFRSAAEEVLVRCIESVWEVVKGNEGLISSWVFNVHLDSAIRKVFQLTDICSDESNFRLSSLKDFLGSRHYYL